MTPPKFIMSISFIMSLIITLIVFQCGARLLLSRAYLARGTWLGVTITMRPMPGAWLRVSTLATPHDFRDAARMAAEFTPILGRAPAEGCCRVYR